MIKSFKERVFRGDGIVIWVYYDYSADNKLLKLNGREYKNKGYLFFTDREDKQTNYSAYCNDFIVLVISEEIYA